MIGCESIGEIRRKDIRREKLEEYWIYWKSIGNIRKRRHLPHENITEVRIGSKFIDNLRRKYTHADTHTHTHTHTHTSGLIVH